MSILEKIIVIFGVVVCILAIYISEPVLHLGLYGSVFLVLFLFSGIVFIYYTSTDVKT